MMKRTDEVEIVILFKKVKICNYSDVSENLSFSMFIAQIIPIIVVLKPLK